MATGLWPSDVGGSIVRSVSCWQHCYGHHLLVAALGREYRTVEAGEETRKRAQ